MRRILITGAAGFSGTHLARHLARREPSRIVGIDVAPSPPPDAALDDYVCASVLDTVALADLLREARPDFVFHLAGIAAGRPTEIYRVNLLGGISVLECICEVVPAARVLVVGSAAEYGPVAESDLPITEDCPCKPSGPYGISRHSLTTAALGYWREFGLRTIVARPFNIIGAGLPATLVVGAVLRRIQEAVQGQADPRIVAGNVETQRDFVAVEDVVEAYDRLLESDRWGEVFNLCSGQPRSIGSVIHRLIAMSGRSIRLEIDPALLRTGDPPAIFGSWQKAYRAIGFTPKTGIEESLRSAWDHAMRGDGPCARQS